MSKIETKVVPDLTGRNQEGQQGEITQQPSEGNVQEVELSDADAQQLEEILGKEEDQLSDAEKKFLEDYKDFIVDDTLQKEIEEGIGIEFTEDFFSGDLTPERVIQGFSEYAEEISNKQFERAFETIYNLDPRAYEVVRMMDQGISFEEAIGKFSSTNELKQLAPGDELQAEQKIRNELKANGVLELAIDNTITQLKEEGTLVSQANNIIQNQLQEQQQEAYRIQEAQMQREIMQEEMENYVYDELDHQIFTKGKIGNFTIPVNDRNAFLRYLEQNMEVTSEGQVIFYDITTADNIDQSIINKWFAFKGGDFNSFIEAEAKTKNAQRIKRKIKKTSSMPSGTGMGSSNTVQLTDIFK